VLVLLGDGLPVAVEGKSGLGLWAGSRPDMGLIRATTLMLGIVSWCGPLVFERPWVAGLLLAARGIVLLMMLAY
jgi:hypothetical protein